MQLLIALRPPDGAAQLGWLLKRYQAAPFPGVPAVEAERLFCHEYFSLARPRGWSEPLTELFAVGAALTAIAADKGEPVLTR